MKFPVIDYEVSKLSESNNFFGNPEHAMKTNIEIPLDGNHRLYKAKQLNFKDIPCYVLPADYHKKFIIDYDEDIYNDVIAEFT